MRGHLPLQEEKELAQAEESLAPPEGDYVSTLEAESRRLRAAAAHSAAEMENYYTTLMDKAAAPEGEAEVEQEIRSLRRALGNMGKAYIQTYAVTDELNGRWSDLKKLRRRKRLAAPPNAVIDQAERLSNHFARGLNLYKLLLVCFLGSFAGVVVEMLWCLATNGYLESRAGLVYGPFNLLYGVGAVALTVSLYRFRNHGSWLSFLGGMVVGSIVEYVCSWGQEMLFGSRSWDYSHMPFNLNGRICLLYSIFWGVLGVLWMKNIYPRMAKWILKLPNRMGKILTWVLTAFFIFNAVTTCLAMTRWTQRQAGVEAQGDFWRFVDAHFPDERMERIFANMEFQE